MRSHGIKIFLFIISFILSLSFLEGGLRLTGLYLIHNTDVKSSIDDYETDTHYEVYNNPNQSKSNTIICIGDSFTNGGNVQNNWKENYPYHLASLLKKKTHNNSVLNMGLCEDTTLGVYNRLQAYINNNEKKPKYIVVLAGSADGFHYKSTESLNKIKWINPMDKISNNEKSWFYTLRIYKMYRHISNQINHKLLVIFTKKSSTDKIWRMSEQYQKAIEAQNLSRANEILDKSIKFIKKSIPYEERLDKQYFFYRDLIEPIVVSIANSNLVQYRYDDALTALLKVSENFPQVWEVYGMRLLTFQIFRKQSKVSAKVILDLIKKNPEVYNRKDVKDFYVKFEKFSKNEINENKVRINIWKKIKALSRKNNIKLIIQNYPSNYSSVNRGIQFISDLLSIPLVNNRKIFKALIAKNGRKPYLKGDDHCTDLGYQIIAKNVAKVIRELEELP